MDNILLSVKALTKKYKKDRVALNNINLDFKLGQFYALLGENGAGKSTLMRLLTQNESITSGDILYKGLSLNSVKNNLNEESVYVDEEVPLSINKTLVEWAKIIKNTTGVYDFQVFEELTKAFSLDRNQLFYSLSRGQKAKALFALGAPKKPMIYLLDEITSVLDIGSRFNLINFLEREVKRRNCTVIMSTNIATELPSLNTHICFLKEGRLELNCHYNELAHLFKKVITTNKTEEDRVLDSGGRFVAYNTDLSKVFVLSSSQNSDPLSDLKEDKRKISISEMMTYYTSQSELEL